MPQNIELKARSINFRKQSEIAKSLSGSGPEVIYLEGGHANKPIVLHMKILN